MLPASPCCVWRKASMTELVVDGTASRPEDLGRLFVARANAGDIEGLVALYEPDAVLALPGGYVARGCLAIREAYIQLLATRPTFQAGEHRPALVKGDLALTSTKLVDGDATAEIARRQSDGSWLWAVDQPSVLGRIAGRSVAVPQAEPSQDSQGRA